MLNNDTMSVTSSVRSEQGYVLDLLEEEDEGVLENPFEVMWNLLRFG